MTATQTAPGSATFTSPPLAGASFTLNVATRLLTAYSYTVTATVLAGNPSTATVISGNDLLEAPTM